MALKTWLQRIVKASRKDLQQRLKRFETTVPNFVFLCITVIGFSFLMTWNQSVVVEIKLFAFGYVLAIVVLVFIVYKFFLSEEAQQKRSRAWVSLGDFDE